MVFEQIIVGEETEYPLKGILTLPDTMKEPVPAVVLVHGSGASNMDEKIGRLTPFKDLAEGLAAYGIASIRYDKRSFAHGIKMLQKKDTVITVKEETIDDALAATELLRKDARINPDHIFIIGHSMGAMLAPRIDAEGGNYQGLILLAGTLRKLEEIVIQQSNELLNSAKGLVRSILKKQITSLQNNFDGLYDLTDDDAKKKKFGGGTTLYYFKEMGKHPATDYLENMKKPLLIMQGEKDFQVKADIDFRGYQDFLKGKDNVSFRLYENLNHAFVPSIYGSLKKAKKEYNVEQHIGEDVIRDISEWIHNAIS